MILILVRHGKTQENKQKIFMGHLDSPLSEEGILQAKKLAERLKIEKIDIIYSSDLVRAKDTAKEIAKYHKNSPIEFLGELRERNLGELEGKIKNIKGGKTENSITANPKHGESLESLLARADIFFSKILKKHLHETVLVVGHSGFNRALLTVIKRLKTGDLLKMDSPRNASISIFEIGKDRNYKVQLFDSIEHLN